MTSFEKLVTGNFGGLCVLWDIKRWKQRIGGEINPNEEEKEEKERVEIEPYAVLSGHESTVVTMTECVFDFTRTVCTGTLS